MKIYETKRLILRALDENAVELVLDYYMKNKGFLEEWEPAKTKLFYTKEFHINQLNQDKIKQSNGNGLRLWIFLKDEITLIGTINFDNIIRGAFLSCNLGYKLDKDEINKGYITEAIQKGIEIMFNEYGLHRIEANVMPKNSRSIRVCEKLGFYNEGLAFKYLNINGKWEDHIHMVLLNNNV